MLISPQRQLSHTVLIWTLQTNRRIVLAMPDNSTLPAITRLWLLESLGVFSQETLDLYSGLIDNIVIPYFGDSVEISQSQVEEFMQAKLESGHPCKTHPADPTIWSRPRILPHAGLELAAAHPKTETRHSYP